MMHILGVTLLNVWLCSSCFKATAVSRRCEWDSEKSKLVESYYWVWHQFSFSDFSRKGHTQGIFNCRRVLLTHISMFYFMLIKVQNYLAPNFTTGDLRIQVRGPPANYVNGSHMTLVTRGSFGYSSHQKGVIQGHLVHRYASRRAPALCSMIMFRTVLPLDVSTQNGFLYYVRKICLEGLFLMFCGVLVTHWLLCQTVEINTIFLSFIGYIYEGTGEF